MKLKKDNFIVKKLNLYNLTFEKFLALKKYFYFFLKEYKKRKLKIKDISLGNILICSLFLKNKKNFNKSLKEAHIFLDMRNKVYNITKGENLFLLAILENGKIVLDEENFESNINPFKVQGVLPNAEFPREIYFIERKI